MNPHYGGLVLKLIVNHDVYNSFQFNENKVATTPITATTTTTRTDIVEGIVVRHCGLVLYMAFYHKVFALVPDPM